MFAAPTRHGMPEPGTREQVEESIKSLLSLPTGEMLHLGGEARDHIVADRGEVARAIELSRRLNPAEPVDAMEPLFSDLWATLASPRIWRCVTRLADTLRKERLLHGERCAAVLKAAMADHRAAAFSPAPMTRRITVTGEPRR